MRLTVLTGSESIGSGFFLPSSPLRRTLIVTLVISWKLNVEQGILVLIPTYSDILFSTVLI